jgi:Asp/Glu/hydantoin racemase
VVLIHATLQAVQPMLNAIDQYRSEIEVINLLDEGLLAAVNGQGGVTPAILDSFRSLLQRGAAYGADGILLSCSAFSPYVKQLEAELDIPVVSVDGAMLEQAVMIGERIGVLATVEAAGATTRRQLLELAARRGKKLAVQVEVVAEAFSELQHGNGERHDELIRQAADKMVFQSDVLVLAQISMARASNSLSHLEGSVLTSSDMSVKMLMCRLSEGKEADF